MKRPLSAVLERSARLHRSTISLLETLPPEFVTKHLAKEAREIAGELEEALADLNPPAA